MIRYEGERPDFDAKGLIIWTLYRNPLDYPGKWVVRPHRVAGSSIEALAWCLISDTQEELNGVWPLAQLCWMPRTFTDDPVIEGVWI